MTIEEALNVSPYKFVEDKMKRLDTVTAYSWAICQLGFLLTELKYSNRQKFENEIRRLAND